MSLLHICSLIFILNQIYRNFAVNNPFCDLPCGQNHIVCVLEPCNKGIPCGANLSIESFSTMEIDLIVKLHNQVRDNVAKGEGSPIQASNMMSVSYDKGLAFIAQCLANTCHADSFHSYCLSTETENYIGYNIYTDKTLQSRIYRPTSVLKDALNMWKSQKNLLSFGDVDSYINMEPMPMMFARLIYSETRLLGLLDNIF